MDITDIRDRRIMITIHNHAPVPCVISDIYFVDGDTFSISVQSVRQQGMQEAPACGIDAGVVSRTAVPEPYHDSNTYQVTNGLQHEPGAMQGGIKPNESLGIVFDLQAGVTLADIVSRLSKGMLNISLKLLGASHGDAGILVNDSRLALSPR